jgi:peptidyl-prolyl cis-trans isomerase A (cyclophilin A)
VSFAFVVLALALDPTGAPASAAPAPAAPEAKAAVEATPTPAGPVVVLETSLGAIKIELDSAKAPITVDNFLQYARSGHYDGTIFHRVKPRFMIQGGGMNVSMIEKPTRPPIKNEHSNGLQNVRGTVAMARLNEPNSATSQFFINVVDNAFLDRGDGYAVFGKVVDGMDVADKIALLPTTSKPPHDDVPKTPVIIEKVRVVFDPKAAAAAPAAKPAAAKSAKPAAASDAPKTKAPKK